MWGVGTRGLTSVTPSPPSLRTMHPHQRGEGRSGSQSKDREAIRGDIGAMLHATTGTLEMPLVKNSQTGRWSGRTHTT